MSKLKTPLMSKSRSNPNSPKMKSKKLNFQFSPKLQKRLTQRKTKKIPNLKKFKFKDKKNTSSYHKTNNKSYRMASPQLKKRNSNYTSKPFYSPNLKSNKASKISSLFNKDENRKKLFNGGGNKINTFQERLDRFKIESRKMMKTIVKHDDEDSEDISHLCKDKKMVISKLF